MNTLRPSNLPIIMKITQLIIPEIKQEQKTNNMKTVQLKTSKMVTVVLAIVLSITMNAQVGGWNPELINDSEEALQTMLEKTPKLESFYNESYGYAVFPRITKAGIAFGGAFGKGVVYKNHQVIVAVL